MGMGQIVDYSQFILQIEKAIANGVASLDSNAKVPKNQISLNASDVGAIATGGTAGTANQLTAPRTISTTGDATYSVSFDGSTNVSSAITLANTGVAAGTYNALSTQVRPFTVDAKGRITGVGTPVDITPPWSAITGKPTTLNGYGITDALNLAGGNITGNLGLGVSSPTVKLSIGRLGGAFSVPTLNNNTAALITAGGGVATSGSFLSILGGNTSQVAVTFGDSDAAEQGGIYYNNSTDTLDLRAGNSNRISISSGTTTFSSTTTSTSTTTGGVVFGGGIGVAGNANIGGNINGVLIGIGVDNTSVKIGAGSASANIAGIAWTVVGRSAGVSCTGNSWTAFGAYSGALNTSGSGWTGVGMSAGYSINGSNWVALGSSAGRYIADGTTALTSSTNSCFIGTLTKGTNGATNENVFGYNATGNGSNTVTIGDNNITNTYLKGVVSTDSTATSTSTTTGAIVASSLGLTGNLHVGGFTRVVSSAQFSGFVVSNGGVTVAQLQGSSVTNDIGALTLRSASVANVLISASGNSFLNGGNFGLGTNNPSYPLDVVGIGRITDQLLVTGTTPSTSTTTGAVVVSGGVGVGGAIFAGSYNLIPIGRGNGNISTNTAVGVSAGQSNTTGFNNSFVGVNAGRSNTTGFNNSFVGVEAGLSNTTGLNNSFVGVSAGRFIADGVTGLTIIDNSCYFGMNTKGTQNATNENVFGYNATGNGSNTVTIGDNNITNNFFRGALSLNATQVISTRRTGWAAPTGTATRTTFSTETVTLSQLAERVKALIDDLTTHGLIGA